MEDNTPTPPTPEAPIVKPVKTANSPLTVILLLIILILIGTTTFFGYQNMQLSKQVSEKKITTSPSPSSTPDPTANWKTYQSKTVGYSIRVPSTWKLTTQQEDSSLLSHQDYLVNMMLSSEKATEGEGDFVNSIIIIFPIKIAGPHKDIGSQYEQGLEGLASQIKNTDSSKQTFQYISIDGKRTLLKLQVNNPTPPANFAGSYFSGSTKTAYIDLGNGSILTISGSWDNQYPNFESTFDQILSTFQFNNSTNEDVLQTIKDLTQPMVWSAPNLDSRTLPGSPTQTLEGQSMTSTIPEKSQDKFAPLFATSSALTTNQGWVWINGAGGVNSESATFNKTINNKTMTLIISSNLSANQYTVFISN